MALPLLLLLLLLLPLSLLALPICWHGTSLAHHLANLKTFKDASATPKVASSPLKFFGKNE